MHPQLLGGSALISPVARQDLQNVSSLELPNSFRVWDARAVHLGDKTVQFAFQNRCSLLAVSPESETRASLSL